MQREVAAPLGASNHVTAFVRDSLVIAEAEIRKLLHDPYELGTRAIQPALWLLIFGQVMAHIRGIATGPVSYQQFLTPGILAQSALFVSIFYGISVIWERDLGVLAKYIASPAPRGALVLGKGLGAGVRALSQAVIVLILALLMRIRLEWNIANLLALLLAILLGAGVFCTLSLIVACIVKTRERFMGIGQVLTMPLFFASNAIYPTALMPQWLRSVSAVNPLSYQVDAMRALMLGTATSSHGLALDFGVLTAVFAGLLLIAARLYPQLLY